MPIPLASINSLQGISGLGAGGFGAPYPKTFGAPKFDPELMKGINLNKNFSRSSSNAGGWQTLNKENLGAAFQNLLNQVTANPAEFTPNYSMIPEGQPKAGASIGAGAAGGLPAGLGGSGHSPEADSLLGALSTGSINLMDDTGTVSLSPGSINVMSRKGWSAGVNPYGANVNIGPFGLQGTWAGDKSIQATVNLGRSRDGLDELMTPPMMGEFLSETNQGSPPLRTIKTYDLSKYQHGKEGKVQEEQTYIPYGVSGLGQRIPIGMQGPTVDTPLSAARVLMEQQTEDYIRRNPGYRYQ